MVRRAPTGTLNIFRPAAYVPAESDIFNVMTYASRAGSFSTCLAKSPGAQVTFSVDTASDPKTPQGQEYCRYRSRSGV